MRSSVRTARAAALALTRGTPFAAPLLGFTIATIAATTTARADFGPKFGEPPMITVALDGAPLDDDPFQIAIIAVEVDDSGGRGGGRGGGRDRDRDRGGGGGGGDDNNSIAPMLAGFDTPSLPPLDDCRVLMTIRGRTRRKIRIAPFSCDRFRVILRLERRNLQFVSNAIDTHLFHSRYTLSLSSSDSTARLTRDTGGEWAVDWLVELWKRGLPFALTVTLVLESIVVAVTARRAETSRPRALVVCGVANLATLPALWFTTLVVCAVTNSITAALTTLAVCELAAWFIEAEAYRRAAGVARHRAMLISAAANGVSFVAGVLLGN